MRTARRVLSSQTKMPLLSVPPAPTLAPQDRKGRGDERGVAGGRSEAGPREEGGAGGGGGRVPALPFAARAAGGAVPPRCLQEASRAFVGLAAAPAPRMQCGVAGR